MATRNDFADELRKLIAPLLEDRNRNDVRAWYLAQIEGATDREIAETLNVNPDGVRKLVQRGGEQVAVTLFLSGRLDRERIETAIDRCQRGCDPLNEKEEKVFRKCVLDGEWPVTPNYREIQVFRRACVKVLRFYQP